MKPAIHQSQLEMLTGKCAAMYEHRFVNNIVVPPGIAVHSGTGVHESAARNYLARLATGQYLEVEQVVDEAVVGFERALWKSGAIDDNATNRGKAKDRAARLAKLHAVEVAPTRTPRHVEKTFRLDLGSYPIDVVGTIDLVEDNDSISDVKTSGKSPTLDAAHGSVQLSAYALAHNAMNLLPVGFPVDVRLDYLVDGKTPKHVCRESSRNKVDYANFIRRVELANQMIESGIFPPTSPSNWVCSSRWCGYYNDVCPFGRRGRSRHVEQEESNGNE